MKKLLSVLLAVAVLAMAVPSFAQMAIQEISVFAGGLSWEPDDVEERAFLLHGGARLMLTEKFAVEGSVGRWATDRKIEEAKFDVSDMPLFSFSGLIIFPLSQQTPVWGFGGGGIDYHSWSIEGKSPEEVKQCDESESGFGFHFRGGVEYEVAPQIRVGGEFKYFSGELDIEYECAGESGEIENNFSGMSIGGFVRYVFPQ